MKSPSPITSDKMRERYRSRANVTAHVMESFLWKILRKIIKRTRPTLLRGTWRSLPRKGIPSQYRHALLNNRSKCSVPSNKILELSSISPRVFSHPSIVLLRHKLFSTFICTKHIEIQTIKYS